MLDGGFLKRAESNEKDWDYIVFELYGEPLSNYKDLVFEETLQIGLQLLDQIELIHKAGYLHRDMKPSNVTIGHSDW